LLILASNPVYRNRLSNSELEFTTGLQRLVHQSFHATVLSSLPASLATLDEEEMVCMPDLNKGVFFRVLEDIGSYRLGRMLTFSDTVVNLAMGAGLL
jgi:hypothetical protein